MTKTGLVKVSKIHHDHDHLLFETAMNSKRKRSIIGADVIEDTEMLQRHSEFAQTHWTVSVATPIEQIHPARLQYSRNTTLTTHAAVESVVSLYYAKPQSKQKAYNEIIDNDFVRLALQLEFRVEAKKSFVSEVKKLAIASICGTSLEAYQRLSSYLSQLEQDNPGNILLNILMYSTC